MESGKYKQLIERLLAKTDKNELDWKEAALPNTFQVSFADYSVTIRETPNNKGDVDYYISILNSEGETVDSVSDVHLDGTQGAGYYFRSMGELFQNARRQALGVDKALNQILDELGEDPF
jgi:hypothetical protein